MGVKLDKVDFTRPVLPPELTVPFNSPLVPDETMVRILKWVEYCISVKPAECNGNLKREIVRELFPGSTESELAAKVRLLANGNGHVSEETPKLKPPSSNGHLVDVTKKKLTDYIELKRPIVFFALHTAGRIGPERKIAEITLVKINPDGEKENLAYKINPGLPIQGEETELHGIRDEDVKDSPVFREAAPEINKFLKGCDLGGFNILTFDLAVLTKEFERAGIDFSTKDRAVIDPIFIYHKRVRHEPGAKRDLVSAYKLYCGVDLKDTTKTITEIAATVNVLKGQFEMYEDLPRDVKELSEYCLSKHSDNVDASGRFVWAKIDGHYEIVFNFSKQHRDETLKEVIKTDKNYINWMLKSDFPEDVKELLRNALNGIYPEPPDKNGNGHV